MAETDALADDRVYLALTRPATFMGLPIDAAMVIIIIGMLIMGWSHNPIYAFFIGGAMYLPARMIVHYDINAFRLWSLWLQTTFLSKNRKFWGGGSYSPVRLKPGVKRKYFGDD